jgi:septal ring factor EnvC (AmiA/AmiB activator)
MKLLKFSTLILLVFLTSNSLNAQEQTESINEGSINDQFEYLLRKSYNFRGNDGAMYENVRRSMLLTLKAHTNDSINRLKETLANTNTVVANQEKEINDLKSNLTQTQGTLDATNKEKDSMSLMGMQMSKTSYNILLWSIIGGLFVMLLVFIFKFKNSNAVTRTAKKSLADLEMEFEEHRRVALEREQKVRRQLQDEINKQKG